MTQQATSPAAGPIQETLQSALRHKWKVGSFCLLVIIVTASVILWYPRSYRSESELFVRVGRETVALDPTATTGQMVQITGSRQHEINSTVQMLASRSLAEKVVDQLGPAAILGNAEGVPAHTSASVATALSNAVGGAQAMVANVDPIDARERAILKMQESIHVTSPRDTSIVSVTYTADTPQRAQQMNEALLQAYMGEHVRIHRTPGSHKFFEEQTKLMQHAWEKASQKLRDTKNQLGLVSIEVQSSLLAGEISRLESQLATSTTSQAATTARVAELESLMTTTPARTVIAQESGFPNEALDNMRKTLYDLEIRERELLTKYTGVHPEVIAIGDQVAQAREILDEQEDRRSRSTTAPNPAFEQLELDLNSAKAEASSLAARTAKLQHEVSQVKQKIETLNANQVLIAELEQQVELTHRNYLAHSEKLEQARIDGALQVDRISNVNIIQPASLEMKPATPRKGLVAAVGLAIAILGSVVIVAGSEKFQRSESSAV